MRGGLFRAVIAFVAVACTYSVPNVIVRGDGGSPEDAGLDSKDDVATGSDADSDGGVGDAAVDAAFPQALTTELLLHLRADDLTLADDDAVASWTDVAGNDFAFTQTVAESRPKFRAPTAGEPKAVEFAKDTHLALGSAESASFRFAAGISFTAVAVFRTVVTTPDRYEQILGNEFAGSSNRVGFGLDLDSQTGHAIFTVHQGCDGGCTEITGQVDVHDGKWHWMAGVREGDGLRLYIDGKADGTLPSGAGVSIDTADDLRVGASAFNALPFVGRVAEILVWRRALSDVDLALLDGHLRARLPIAP